MRIIVTAVGGNNVALIVDLTVGLGGPLIILLVALIIFFCAHRWDSKNIKQPAAPIDDESIYSEVSASLSTTLSTAPIAGISSTTEPDPAKSFYWAPEKPEGTADLNNVYTMEAAETGSREETKKTDEIKETDEAE